MMSESFERLTRSMKEDVLTCRGHPYMFFIISHHQKEYFIDN
jgi:hypothetical protein